MEENALVASVSHLKDKEKKKSHKDSGLDCSLMSCTYAT